MDSQSLQRTQMSARTIVFAGLIAATYAVVTIALSPISFGPIQFRMAGLLIPLCLVNPVYGLGLAVGLALANLASPFGIYDYALMPLEQLGQWDGVGAMQHLADAPEAMVEALQARIARLEDDNHQLSVYLADNADPEILTIAYGKGYVDAESKARMRVKELEQQLAECNKSLDGHVWAYSTTGEDAALEDEAFAALEEGEECKQLPDKSGEL